MTKCVVRSGTTTAGYSASTCALCTLHAYASDSSSNDHALVDHVAVSNVVTHGERVFFHGSDARDEPHVAVPDVAGRSRCRSCITLSPTRKMPSAVGDLGDGARVQRRLESLVEGRRRPHGPRCIGVSTWTYAHGIEPEAARDARRDEAPTSSSCCGFGIAPVHDVEVGALVSPLPGRGGASPVVDAVARCPTMRLSFSCRKIRVSRVPEVRSRR